MAALLFLSLQGHGVVAAYVAPWWLVLLAAAASGASAAASYHFRRKSEIEEAK